MSVVAVKIYDDQIIIGSDNQLTVYGCDKDIKTVNKPTKLFQVGKITFGAAGNGKDIVAMKQYLQETEPKGLRDIAGYYRFLKSFYDWAENKSITIEKEESDFLFVAEDKCFLISNFYIEEIDDFSAIGAGASKAMIGLSLGHSVKESLEATCTYDLYCHEPVIIHEIKKIDKGKK